MDSATVLTSPASSPIRMLQPPLYLNISNGLPSGLLVIDKERGSVELPAVDLFEVGLLIISYHLAPEDFYEYIPSQAWTFSGMVLGVSVKEWQAGTVQRSLVELGIYFIFLLMKNEHDFRSGDSEIRYGEQNVCDIVIFPAGSSGLKKTHQPSLAHVTQLAPPSPIAYNTNNSSQFVASASGLSAELKVYVTPIEPSRPLDRLDLLISLLDTLVTVAQSPAGDRVQSHTENTVSGVKTSISPAIGARPPFVMTYKQLIYAAQVTSYSISDESEGWARNALRIQLFLSGVYIGEMTMVPSNSSAPTSLLIEGNVNASTGTTTARKKRLIA